MKHALLAIVETSPLTSAEKCRPVNAGRASKGDVYSGLPQTRQISWPCCGSRKARFCHLMAQHKTIKTPETGSGHRISGFVPGVFAHQPAKQSASPPRKFRKARSNTDTCKQTHFLHPRRRKLVAGDSLQKRLCRRQTRCLAQWKRFEEPSKISDLSTGHPVLNSGNGPWRCSSMLTAVQLSE